MYARLTLYSLLACCWAAHLLGTNAAAALLLLSYLVTGGNYTLYLLYHTAGRDARGAWRYLQLLILVYVYQKRNLTVSQVFQRTVKKHPNKVALYFEDESWTFKQVTVNRFFPSLCRGTATLLVAAGRVQQPAGALSPLRGVPPRRQRGALHGEQA